MAGFRTHITASSALGVGYTLAGYHWWHLPVPTCLLAGGLCGLAGMLPDVDSDSSVPLRETLALAAALAPMLMMDHFVQWGLSHDNMAVAAGCIYILVRFGIGQMLRRYTVHRGMWHSLPAAAIAALVALMLWSQDEVIYRWFKAGAVFLGYLSHLMLDQLYGLTRSGGAVGSPLKLWRADPWANTSTYLKLSLLLAWVAADPHIMQSLGLQESAMHTVMRDLVHQLRIHVARGVWPHSA